MRTPATYSAAPIRPLLPVRKVMSIIPCSSSSSVIAASVGGSEGERIHRWLLLAAVVILALSGGAKGGHDETTLVADTIGGRGADDAGGPVLGGHQRMAGDGTAVGDAVRGRLADDYWLVDSAPDPAPTGDPLEQWAEVLRRADAPEHESAVDPVISEATLDVYVTFYTCPPYCGLTAAGIPVGEGIAACDPAYMGRRFVLNGEEWLCADTGSAVHGAHVDLFFQREADGWAYLAEHGTQGRLMWLK